MTDDNLPVHSFRTLLADLATITKNTVEVKRLGNQPARFEKLARPTPAATARVRLARGETRSVDGNTHGFAVAFFAIVTHYVLASIELRLRETDSATLAHNAQDGIPAHNTLGKNTLPTRKALSNSVPRKEKSSL